MTTGKVVLVTVLAGVISIGFAIYGKQWLGEGEPINIQLPALAQSTDDRLHSLPDFRLPDPSGREIASTAWAGKVLVLNFWATWCPPCLREMAVFAEVQDSYRRLQVLGIAIDDPGEVSRFLAEHPVNYPVLIGDTDAVEMSRRLGNRLQGLPFTVIFDAQGKRVHAQVGEMTRASLEKHIAPMLAKSSGTQTAGN
jgi:thiol-disulfide isomerase/thioredoxin